MESCKAIRDCTDLLKASGNCDDLLDKIVDIPVSTQAQIEAKAALVEELLKKLCSNNLNPESALNVLKIASRSKAGSNGLFSGKSIDLIWSFLRCGNQNAAFNSLSCINNVLLQDPSTLTEWMDISPTGSFSEKILSLVLVDLFAADSAQLDFAKVRTVFLISNYSQPFLENVCQSQELVDAIQTFLSNATAQTFSLPETDWTYRLFDEVYKLCFLCLSSDKFSSKFQQLIILIDNFLLWTDSTVLGACQARLLTCLLQLISPSLSKDVRQKVCSRAGDLVARLSNALGLVLDKLQACIFPVASPIPVQQILADSQTLAITILHIMQGLSEQLPETFNPLLSACFDPSISKSLYNKVEAVLLSSPQRAVIDAIGFCLLSIEENSVEKLLQRYKYEVLAGFLQFAGPSLQVDWNVVGQSMLARTQAAKAETDADEMTDEEKEREADKIMTLLSRLQQTGVIKADMDALLKNINQSNK